MDIVLEVVVVEVIKVTISVAHKENNFLFKKYLKWVFSGKTLLLD
jgi:hypothetical protein